MASTTFPSYCHTIQLFMLSRQLKLRSPPAIACSMSTASAWCGTHLPTLSSRSLTQQTSRPPSPDLFYTLLSTRLSSLLYMT